MSRINLVMLKSCILSSVFDCVTFIKFFLSQIPGEVDGEAVKAGKKTLETVKAVRYST